MRQKLSLLAFACALGLGSAATAQAASWDVTVTNLTNGNYFTPLLVASHDHDTHMFEVGESAATYPGIELMAECGDLSELTTTFDPMEQGIVENPNGGPLAPGASVTTTLTTAMGDTHLSVVAMILPTNDAFVGLNSVHIDSEPGTYTFYMNAYDAGTEANDELMSTGCDTSTAGIPADPGGMAGSGGTAASGNDGNTMIHVHRGILGGASDLDSSIHRWQNPVARVVVTVN
ncbi:MAG: spondin domain-containing protein [Gammaproteobacteria bacterium]|jgi:hypothetical protein